MVFYPRNHLNLHIQSTTVRGVFCIYPTCRQSEVGDLPPIEFGQVWMQAWCWRPCCRGLSLQNQTPLFEITQPIPYCRGRCSTGDGVHHPLDVLSHRR